MGLNRSNPIFWREHDSCHNLCIFMCLVSCLMWPHLKCGRMIYFIKCNTTCILFHIFFLLVYSKIKESKILFGKEYKISFKWFLTITNFIIGRRYCWTYYSPFYTPEIFFACSAQKTQEIVTFGSRFLDEKNVKNKKLKIETIEFRVYLV